MDIKVRQVPNARGDSRYFLYCSAECAAEEPDRAAHLQPLFAAAGLLMGPDHTGHACRVCQRKLTGPAPPPVATSHIPVAPAPHRPKRPGQGRRATG